MKKILFASNNLHKVNEIRNFFNNEIKFILPSELGIFDLAEENGITFSENAEFKVKHFPDNIDYPILADDSGLIVKPLSDFISNLKKIQNIDKNDNIKLYEIFNFFSISFEEEKLKEKIENFWKDYLYRLDYFPGVVSKRFGYIDDEKIRNKYLIELLKKIDKNSNQFNFTSYKGKWAAYFETSLALRYNGKIYNFSGKAEGFIIDTPKGNNGFGYDPIFFYPPLNKTFAELTLEEKNMVSHRSKALEKLKEAMEKIY